MDRIAAEALLEGIAEKRVRQAFLSVDREQFVRPGDRSYAWRDHALPIEGGATISQPSLVARMTELLDVGPEHRVLEIGTGSGYQTSILGHLAREVFTVEVHPRLAERAEARLSAMGYTNVRTRCGDGAKGWPEEAPFDRILATVAFPAVPDALVEQLAPEGLLLAPIGPETENQWLTLCRRADNRLETRRILPVRFLSLRQI